VTEGKAESDRWEQGKRPPRAHRRVSLKRQPLTVPRWYALLVICVSLVSLAGMNIAYTSYVDSQREKAERKALAAVHVAEREADRRWCSFLTTLRDALSQSTNPDSPFVVSLSREVTSLILSTGC
jgi:hypothetical protein